MATTPNMGIIKPVPLSDSNLAGTTEVNAGFDVIDSHNHTAGLGIQIPTLGLNINADLPFNSFGATGLKYINITGQGGTLASSFKGYVYSAPGGGSAAYDLWYNDANGFPVQLTKNGLPNQASSGSILGMTGTANVTYTAGTFAFQQATNVPSVLDTGDIIVRKAGATSPQGITITTVNSLASGYQITLPAAPPGVGLNLPVSMDHSGNLTAGQITTAQIADGAVTGGPAGVGVKLAASTITKDNIANGAVGKAQLAASTIYSSSLISGNVTNTAYSGAAGSVTPTLTGRPVLITLVPNTSGGSSYLSVTNSGTVANMTLGLSSNGGASMNLGESLVEIADGNALATFDLRVPVSSLHILTGALGAGSPTIGLYAKVNTGTTGSIVNCILNVLEL